MLALFSQGLSMAENERNARRDRRAVIVVSGALEYVTEHEDIIELESC